MPGTPRVQAMAVNRAGSREASPETLVVDAPLFSYEHAEAWEKLREMAATVNASWRSLCSEHCGVAEDELERLRPAFKLAEGIDTGVMTLDLATFTGRRRRVAATP
jgi:serine/threonine-protein kinase HipA